MTTIGRRLLLLAVPRLELGHATAAVQDLLLTGVERVAVGADVGVDDAVSRGAARGERVATRTGDRGLHVLGVNLRLHECAPRTNGRRVGHRGTPVNRNLAWVRTRTAVSVFRTVPTTPNRRPHRAQCAGCSSSLVAPLVPSATLGVEFFTCMRNSTLPLVSLSLPSNNSIACWG